MFVSFETYPIFNNTHTHTHTHTHTQTHTELGCVCVNCAREFANWKLSYAILVARQGRKSNDFFFVRKWVCLSDWLNRHCLVQMFAKICFSKLMGENSQPLPWWTTLLWVKTTNWRMLSKNTARIGISCLTWTSRGFDDLTWCCTVRNDKD